MPISARELRECIKKLQDGKDITKKEAVSIRSRYNGKRRNFSEYHLNNFRLSNAYEDWFKAVLKRLPEFGNYVQTIPINKFIFNSVCDKTFIDLICECINKMSVIDRASQAGYLKGWSDNAELFYPKWAGDLRFTEPYRDVASMVPLFEGRKYYFGYLGKIFYDEDRIISRFLSSVSNDGLNSNKKLQLLQYFLTVISIAHKMNIPVLNVEAENENPDIQNQVILVYPKDKEKLKGVLSVSPEEFFEKAFRAGLFKALCEELPSVDVIYDRMGEFLCRCCLMKKKKEIVEDDDWMEIER